MRLRGCCRMRDLSHQCGPPNGSESICRPP
jgi:hypothetical protein